MSDRTILEALANGPTRRQAIVGVAMACGGLTLGSTKAWAGAEDGISHTADTIHQEAVFTASRKRVYEALTDAKQFDKVIQLSGVMQAMHLPDKPAEISREVGGAFTLLCRPGERAAGLRASIRLQGSSWWSRAPGPGSYLTIPAFRKAKRKSWRRDGKRTIGSRSANSWPRFLRGTRESEPGGS
jgi:hypothetical protein